jgi:ketosteroid isomerase-like protein
MSQENVQIVRDMLLASSHGNPLAALPTFDPASEWDMSGVSAWPEKDVYRGLDEIRAFLTAWAGSWAEWHFDVQDVRAASDGRVYAAIHEWGIGAGSGVGVDQYRYSVLTIRDGLIVRLQMFSDRSDALGIAGLATD